MEGIDLASFLGTKTKKSFLISSQEACLYASKSISRILYHAIAQSLSFIYVYCYQQTLAAYPLTLCVQHLSVSLHGIAPHRVYPISLQHYLYILSVALFLASRLVVVNHYGALWCSDFPLRICAAIRQFTHGKST